MILTCLVLILTNFFQSQQKDYELLNDDDIEGQEDETIERDGEIKITPFNLKEEQVKNQCYTGRGGAHWGQTTIIEQLILKPQKISRLFKKLYQAIA
jgi:hypothetical protein